MFDITPRKLLLSLVLMLLLSAVFFDISLAENKDPHQHHAAPRQEESTEISLNERLGAKIDGNSFFVDETGKQVRLGDLITGPTIILPVYYTCTNVCNYMQGGLARIIRTLKSKPGQEYRIVSISFDADEKAEQAARTGRMYRTAINVPFPENGWYFLTGDPENIRRFTDSIGYRYKKQGRDFIHPVASLIVAGDGTIVRYLYGTTFLTKDISLALLEARDGKVGATVRKVVDYCFTFDPKGKTYVFNVLRVSATVVILCAVAFLLFLVISGKKCKPRVSEEP